MKPYVVALTGASGIRYGVRLVQKLIEMDYPVELVISEPGRLVIREELGISLKSFTHLEDLIPVFGEKIRTKLRAYSPKDFSASIASGSYPTAGMIIAPCTVGTVAALANGISQNLIHRAADCMIKENRRLILVPRETPLSAIHLDNMAKLARLGVRIVPAMPAFYSGAQSLEDMIDFMVGKILDQLDISHALYPRWIGLAPAASQENQ